MSGAHNGQGATADDPPSPDPAETGENGSGQTKDPAQSANQASLSYLERHGYNKAAVTLKNSLNNQEDAAATKIEGNAGDSSVEADVKPNIQVKKPIPTTQIQSNKPGAIKPQLIQDSQSLPLDDLVRRNVPIANSASTSTSAYTLTPDFIQQAENVVKMHMSKTQRIPGTTTGADIPLLDSTDRIKGYVKLRNWVESGLESWKPELREVLFPIFVHTFLDLIETARNAAAEFFKNNSPHHVALHKTELELLRVVNSPAHILVNPFVKRLRSEKYVINVSRSAFGLLVGWLSDIGLEALWDVPRDTGRYKDAIRHLIQARLELKVSSTSTPLSIPSIASRNGLMQGTVPGSINVETFNAKESLRLGLPAVGANLAKLTEIQLEKTKPQEEEDAPARALADTDVDMEQPGNATSDDQPNHTKGDVAVEVLEPISRGDVLGFGTVGNFASIDLAREVKAVTDARKRIKLGDKAMVPGASGYYSRPSLPSACCYTIFDGGEGTTSTAISEDASYLAAGSAESVIRLWSLKGDDLKTRDYGYATRRAQGGDEEPTDAPGKPMRKLVGHSGPVYSLSFDPVAGSAYPPSHLLSSSQDGSVRLWSLDTYKNLVVYKGHADPVWAVEWGPYGAHFATASRDRTARLWITDRVAPVRMFAGHLSDVDCLKFHPNSLYLATGSSDRTCRLWDVQRGECVRVFMGHDDAVDCLAMSPDGRYLASASQDLSIRLWDLNSGRQIKAMTGHTQPIHSLSFSAESSTLVSGGADCTVRVWDVKQAGGRKSGVSTQEMLETTDLLTTYQTKRTPITTTHFTPRNLCLVAGTFVE